MSRLELVAVNGAKRASWSPGEGEVIPVGPTALGLRLGPRDELRAIEGRDYYGGHHGTNNDKTPGGTTRVEVIRERMRWEVHTAADGAPEIRPVEGAASAPAATTVEPVARQRTAASPRPDARRAFQVVEGAPAKSGRSYPERDALLLGAVVLVAAAAGFRATRRHRAAPAPRGTS